jgi:hypothetical protein
MDMLALVMVMVLLLLILILTWARHLRGSLSRSCSTELKLIVTTKLSCTHFNKTQEIIYAVESSYGASKGNPSIIA